MMNRTPFQETGFASGLKMTVEQIRTALRELRVERNKDMRDFSLGLEEALVVRSEK